MFDGGSLQLLLKPSRDIFGVCWSLLFQTLLVWYFLSVDYIPSALDSKLKRPLTRALTTNDYDLDDQLQ